MHVCILSRVWHVHCACAQGGHKKLLVKAGGIPPLVALLSDPNTMTQRHAACALWGLADGKEGVYDKQIVEHGAVRPLLAMLLLDHAPRARMHVRASSHVYGMCMVHVYR